MPTRSDRRPYEVFPHELEEFVARAAHGDREPSRAKRPEMLVEAPPRRLRLTSEQARSGSRDLTIQGPGFGAPAGWDYFAAQYGTLSPSVPIDPDPLIPSVGGHEPGAPPDAEAVAELCAYGNLDGKSILEWFEGWTQATHLPADEGALYWCQPNCHQYKVIQRILEVTPEPFLITAGHAALQWIWICASTDEKDYSQNVTFEVKYGGETKLIAEPYAIATRGLGIAIRARQAIPEKSIEVSFSRPDKAQQGPIRLTIVGRVGRFAWDFSGAPPWLSDL